MLEVSGTIFHLTRLMSEVNNNEAAQIAKEVNAQFMQPQNAGLVAFLQVIFLCALNVGIK